MPQDLFPDPGPDDAEPDGFPPADDAPGLEQGLYVCLPAEHLTLTGFSQGGASDTMAPGALLATVVEAVGLAGRLSHRPGELSGGQQQRVAIARALVSRPAIVFADEPTGNLDSRSSAEVLDLLRRCVTEFGQTVVMVTHDPAAAAYSQRVVFLADGRIAGTLDKPTRETVLERMRGLDGSQPGEEVPGHPGLAGV